MLAKVTMPLAQGSCVCVYIYIYIYYIYLLVGSMIYKMYLYKIFYIYKFAYIQFINHTFNK